MEQRIRQITVGLIGTSALLFAACGVNEMHAYNDQISAVRVEADVQSVIALDVAALAVEEPEVSAGDAAVITTETYLIDRLAERLAHRVDPHAVGARFSGALVDDMARGFDWDLVRPDEAHDTRFLATIEGYGMDVDPFGRADVWFRMRVRGWYLPADKLIYDQWETFEAPLEAYVPINWHPHHADPEAQLAERAYNLLQLNDIPDGLLAEVVYRGAEEAAAELVAELVDDTYAY